MDSQIYLPQSEKLNIGYLSHAFDNKSECYKLFWFQAIIRKVAAGQTEITFDELVDDMIADAWYMVTEYHLNLGPRDNLEAAVNYIYKLKGFRPAEKKEVILDVLQNTDDPEVLRYKRILISNVPYRLQSPFMQTDTAFWNAGQKKLAEKINQFDHLIYYFEKINGLGSIIIVQEAWADYIIANQLISLVRSLMFFCREWPRFFRCMRSISSCEKNLCGWVINVLAMTNVSTLSVLVFLMLFLRIVEVWIGLMSRPGSAWRRGIQPGCQHSVPLIQDQ